MYYFGPGNAWKKIRIILQPEDLNTNKKGCLIFDIAMKASYPSQG